MVILVRGGHCSAHSDPLIRNLSMPVLPAQGSINPLAVLAPVARSVSKISKH